MRKDTTRSVIMPFFGPPDMTGGLNPGQPNGVKCTPEEAVRLQYAVKRWRFAGMYKHAADEDAEPTLTTRYAIPVFGGHGYLGYQDVTGAAALWSAMLDGPFPKDRKIAAYDLAVAADSIPGAFYSTHGLLTSIASTFNGSADFYRDDISLNLTSGPSFLTSAVYSRRSSENGNGGYKDGDDSYFYIKAYAYGFTGSESGGSPRLHAFGKTFEINMGAVSIPGNRGLNIYAEEYWSYGGAIDTKTGDFK
jgi:hypothetical protein